MLRITVPETESFDELSGEFVYTKAQSLALEHSLVSISKWESKWHKPFLSVKEFTVEEFSDYVRCMTITQNVDPGVYQNLTLDNISEINKYMEESMTASWFSKDQTNHSRDVITSEIIYYWMISLNIPFECQKWHINRLLTLIRVCDEKGKPKKNMSTAAILNRNKALNQARRAKYNSKG